MNTNTASEIASVFITLIIVCGIIAIALTIKGCDQATNQEITKRMTSNPLYTCLETCRNGISCGGSATCALLQECQRQCYTPTKVTEQ